MMTERKRQAPNARAPAEKAPRTRKAKAAATESGALVSAGAHARSPIKPPAAAAHTRKRQRLVARALRRVLSADRVLIDAASLSAFECDGLTTFRQRPLVVALPETTREVSEVLKICAQLSVKVVPRGAGTSLSGGALPLADGIILSLTKFNRVLEIDYPNRAVVVQPGVTNLAITHAVADQGFYYAPDPSSQLACSIGGNVAENSGGIHCLKYGLTTNNLLGVEVVLMDGEVLRLGGKHLDACGYDLLGLLTGSEGLLAVITEVTVRILPRPVAARGVLLGFKSEADAGATVAGIIAAGIIPAAVEMMDSCAIAFTEAFVAAGYPQDAAAMLIVELDGRDEEIAEQIEAVTRVARAQEATSIRISSSEEERLRFWAGRKAAFPAAARVAPDYLVMDGTIPRAALARVLGEIAALSAARGLAVANVFHAGDGNLHPMILFDSNQPGQLETAEEMGAEILRLCVKAGGVLSGEHGIGVEKSALMEEVFRPEEINQQLRVKCAFDPQGLLNPGKVFPRLHRCAELGKVHVHGGRLAHPELPRL